MGSQGSAWHSGHVRTLAEFLADKDPQHVPGVVLTGVVAGMLLLWESWLRHGVEPNQARGRRISTSFNYRLD